MRNAMFYTGSAMMLAGAAGLLVLYRWFDLRRVLRQCRSDICRYLNRKSRGAAGRQTDSGCG